MLCFESGIKPSPAISPDARGHTIAMPSSQRSNSNHLPAKLDDHFVVGVYPFTHALDLGSTSRDSDGQRAGDSARLIEILGEDRLWVPWLERTRDPKQRNGPRSPRVDAVRTGIPTSLGGAGVFDDSYFFLPNIREFLFPEFHPVDSATGERLAIGYDAQSYAKVVQHHNRRCRLSPEELARELLNEQVIHLTLAESARNQVEHLQIIDARGGQPLEVVLCWADLYLFPFGCGSLVLCFRLAEEGGSGNSVPDPGEPAPSRMDRLGAAIQRLHMVHPRFIEDELPVVVLAPSGTKTDLRRVLEFCLQSITPIGDQAANCLFTEFLETDRGRADMATSKGPGAESAYTLSEDGQTYGARLYTYTYALTSSTGQSEDLGLDNWTPTQAYLTAAEQALCEMSLRYPLGSTRSDAEERSLELQSEWVRESLLSDGGFQRYANWRAHAYSESFMALGVTNDGFTRSWDAGLPKNLYHDYLQLFIYTIFVRQTLSSFLRKLQKRHSGVSGITALRHVHQDFMRFRKTHWYPEVCGRVQGEDLRGLMTRAIGVDKQYDFVRELVEDTAEAQAALHERMQTQVLTWFSIMIAPCALLIAFFSMGLVQSWPKWVSWPLLVLGILGLVLGLRAHWQRLLSRMDDWMLANSPFHW